MTYADIRTRRWPAPTLALIVAVFLAYSLPPYFSGGTRVPGHLRVALSAAGGPCHVRERGDGVRGGADLAGAASSPPRPAPPRGAGLRVHRDPGRGVCDGHRRGDARSGRSWPSAMCCWRRCGCGSPSTAISPVATGGSQRTAGTWCSARHSRCRSSPTASGLRYCSSRCTRCRTVSLAATRSTSLGRRGHRRLARLDGPDVRRATVADAQTGNAAVVNFSASAYIAGVISGRLGTTRRRTTRTRLGHGNRIQRQDRAGYP